LTRLLGLSFRSNLQSERVERAMEVRTIWEATDKENKDLITNILKQTVAVLKKQVDELRKKKDTDKLKKTVNGFSAFLDRVSKDQKTLTPDFRMLLAQSYMSIGKYKEAEAQVEQFLKKVKEPDPKATPQQAAPYRLARTLQVRTLRLKGTVDNDKKALEKAGKLMDDIMGSDAKPGWGRRDLNALIEQIHVFFDLGFYGAAVNRANALLKIIQPKLQQGGSWVNHYFEVYHLFIYSYLKYGQTKKTAAERTAAVTKAAQYYVKLENNHPTLGGEESAQRFRDLLDKEPELKAAVALARKTEAAGSKKPK
jgi:tetratricopeptide (TPR) repeat protein